MIDRPLADVLDEVEAMVRRYVHLTDPQAAAVTLWIAHTHAIEAAEVTGYLNVHSAEMRSGKTTLLEVTEFLVRKPVSASSMSPSVLFRVVDETRSTILFDEIDTVFTAKSEQDELRGLLNAGYRRGGKAWRIETTGKKHTPRAFDVFGPKLLAGIGTLPVTITDRCIPIELERKGRDIRIARFRRRGKDEEAEPLREALAAWAREAGDRLTEARPDLPDELNDRAQDMWEPLLAIAEDAGRSWPTRARVAAVNLHSGAEEVSVGVQLLAHVREAIEDDTIIGSEQLVEALTKNEQGPWGQWWKVDTESGLRSAKSNLAKRLKPFGIRSTAVKIAPDTTVRGYRREHFTSAWERYLPPWHLVQPPQPMQPRR